MFSTSFTRGICPSLFLYGVANVLPLLLGFWEGKMFRKCLGRGEGAQMFVPTSRCKHSEFVGDILVG